MTDREGLGDPRGRSAGGERFENPNLPSRKAEAGCQHRNPTSVSPSPKGPITSQSRSSESPLRITCATASSAARVRTSMLSNPVMPTAGKAGRVTRTVARASRPS